jgi:oligopeptide/dipeptide ABC transporter ATP-binding protein
LTGHMSGQMSGPLLEVSAMSVAFPTSAGLSRAVDEVEFEVGVGETLGIVGESGCGKSVSLRALLGVVPPPGRVVGGSARWRGELDLLGASKRQLRAVRGREIAMIFQDPQESLNPVHTIGHHLTETLTKRAGLGRRAARLRAVELLERVGIPAPAERLDSYPHQLSGGMRQRVMIAIAVSCEPALLLADEPTTALDVTIQDQILGLLSGLQEELGMAMIMVSHDIGVIGQSCDRVAVMYAGSVVETGTVDEVLDAPRHPYTAGLLAAVPTMVGVGAGEQLAAIPGQPPSITQLPPGCSFAPRCPEAGPACETISMQLDRVPGEHRSACPFVNAAERLGVGVGGRG